MAVSPATPLSFDGHLSLNGNSTGEDNRAVTGTLTAANDVIMLNLVPQGSMTSALAYVPKRGIRRDAIEAAQQIATRLSLSVEICLDGHIVASIAPTPPAGIRTFLTNSMFATASMKIHVLGLLRYTLRNK
ncbi:hypothetical protein GCM10011369_34780 [Neiella marina]|uniref:Uncharacterized protein n=1 Tax=Neiella marina TaxID=508461 RepID=A0A8J2U9Z7_9GAMM|nr:hypothetical protein [Neiella marina]GGA89628.1 hypothetical protein GCM10011369_34780 [Neiella marina]